MFLYWTGGLQQLFAMADGVPASTYDRLFQMAIGILERFVGTTENLNDLPDSVAQAHVILQWLLQIIGTYNQRPETMMVSELRIRIAHEVNAFQTILDRELGHAHTYVLEGKRGHSPSTLVQSRQLLDKKLLPYLSEFTLYNIEDAGTSLVFDRFTACGYHIMRAVEDTTRRYFELVTGRATITIDNGKTEYKNLGQMANELDHVLVSIKKGKQVKLGALGLVAPVLQALCETYRNPLSHPEIVVLEEELAIDVFTKGIDVISTMVRDALKGGPQFSPFWAYIKAL